MSLQVGVVGVNFKTADLRLREEWARRAQDLVGERVLFFPHPIVVVSTCNRTEVYFASDNLLSAHNDLFSFFQMRKEQRIYTFFGRDCFLHLCRVTSGLDSALLGETEIQHQVKLSYEGAKRVLALPHSLHYLFQKAIHVSKGMRSKYPFRRVSLYPTLIEIAEEVFGDVKKRKILLIGYSNMNRGFFSYLKKRGIEGALFCSRIKGEVPLSSWEEYDLIVASTRADGFLIQGGGERQLIFDLSIPRVIDPYGAFGKGVILFDLDTLLKKRVAKNDSLEECEEWVEGHVARLLSFYSRRNVCVGTISNSLGLSF